MRSKLFKRKKMVMSYETAPEEIPADEG